MAPEGTSAEGPRRHSPFRSAAVLTSLLTLAWLPRLEAADLKTLWQIGTFDDSDAEFALAPQGYQRFQQDGFFTVGRSDPQTDWPYVHPGPADGWAGSRPHTFTITFALGDVATKDDARLIVDFVDTHRSSPPRFRATLNGRDFETDLPAGAGDRSVYGDPGQGKAYVWTLEFPADLLHAGSNEITFTTVRGSWALYDAVRLETPEGVALVPEPESTTLTRTEVPPVWLRVGDQPVQPLVLQLRHVGPERTALLQAGTNPPTSLTLRSGMSRLELTVPAVDQTRVLPISLKLDDTVVAATNLILAPPRIRDVWVLPHSHVDVGYTHLQDDVIRIQVQNLETAMRLARESADQPPGQRFRWNPEAIWAIDHFLRLADPQARAGFVEAVRRGDVGIDALYGNMLTGLCRPEELLQALAFAPRLALETGIAVTSAAICDVPGWTWGLVPAMAHAGVKYFAIGPNQSARIGSIHRWDNRPFYWRGQSGRERVLCWVVDNYHHLGELGPQVRNHAADLDRMGFPYDMTFLYWVGTWPEGGVDNAPPDTALVAKVAAWNQAHALPRVRIGLAAEFFREFERRHGAKVPEVAGDLTPYWEDGAGSTSRETALHRAASERLNQAETLFALHARKARSPARVEAAWKNVLLYSEHTWGAHNSISSPDLPFVTNQWRIKQAFALDADRLSGELLALALDNASTEPPATGSAVDVYNTTQWRRTDLVILPLPLAPPGRDRVLDSPGRPVPSQRLASGELAFLARDVPAFGYSRFRVAPVTHGVEAATRRTTEARFDPDRNALLTSALTVELDPGTGAIRGLRRAGVRSDFVDPSAQVALNDFRYVLGTNAAGALTNGPVHILPLDAGPLVVTVRITSQAPGCRSLVREVRVVEGLDHVDLVNHVDRLAVREKDAVHFGFGFHVPGGMVRMETPWGVVRPNLDQLPGACRNWFTVQRWVDVSNGDRGITWAPLDAPLVEVGGLTANLRGEVRLHEWLERTPESTTVYSWAQNNHWFTNYKADQPGVTTFRYRLRPHAGGYEAGVAARAGVESTRPLLVCAGRGEVPRDGTRLTVSAPDVLVETVKTSEDGRAVIVRLFGVSGADRTVDLQWAPPRPVSVWTTDLSERPLKRLSRRIRVPGYGLVSIRAEFEAR